MYYLTQFTLKDMSACGAALREIALGADTMEEVANDTVRYLYDHLLDASGQRATALVRFFITVPYSELADDLQHHVNSLMGHQPIDPALKCQTLLATIGENPDWHNRHRSRTYKVHPLTAQIVDVNPMFAQVAEMFGIVLEQTVDPIRNC